jgi:hypothetical protein
MSATPAFSTPPVVELVLGAQFSTLTKLTSGHFGLFWNEFGSDWIEPSDAPLLEDQFELFDRPWFHPFEEFEAAFTRFELLAEKLGLGRPAVNQGELTYVDSFPRGEYWETPADWSKFLPGLFGQPFPTDGLEITLEQLVAEQSYEIQPRRGRLHIAGRIGRTAKDDRDSLLLQMTARGPVGKEGAATLFEGLNLGHKVTVATFLRLVDHETQHSWGEKS